jgi:hypothetical protein
MLPDTFLENLIEYIADDNRKSLCLYDALSKAYESSLSDYPEEINLLGVYFYDVLKLLTHSQLKKKEIDSGNAPDNALLTKSLEVWPYLGYEDIRSVCNLDTKKYGKGLSSRQTQFRRTLQSLVNLQYYIGRKKIAKVSLLTPVIDAGNNLWLNSSRIETNLIDVPLELFAFPQLEDQLILLELLVKEVMEDNDHLIPVKLITDLLKRHIAGDCTEGRPELQLDGEILLLGSGIELHNRMLSVAAKQKNMSVVNILHGEAFGVYDEPIFSKYGEQMYSNAILGYGKSVLTASTTYQHGLKRGVEYIESNGVNVFRNYEKNYTGFNSEKHEISYYYFPTTLSGISHRYGPYRDTADSLYIKWQKIVLELFGYRIKFKKHPKEKYQYSYQFLGVDMVSGKLDNVLIEFDVFVFDYIGTAFNIACATNKPIVYFDLGIRNIHPDALDEIKLRTVYFDIKDGMPTLDEVQEQLHFKPIENKYSRKYSLCGNNKSRSESLIEGIEKLLSPSIVNSNE